MTSDRFGDVSLTAGDDLVATIELHRPPNNFFDADLVHALADAYEALDRSNRRYLDVYRANRVLWALVEQVATVDPEIHRIRLLGRRRHVERVANTIRRWQERGLADRGIDPRTTAGALVSMLSNFAYWWLAGGDVYDAGAAEKTLTDIWARAVGLPRRARLRRVGTR